MSDDFLDKLYAGLMRTTDAYGRVWWVPDPATEAGRRMLADRAAALAS